MSPPKDSPYYAHSCRASIRNHTHYILSHTNASYSPLASFVVTKHQTDIRNTIYLNCLSYTLSIFGSFSINCNDFIIQMIYTYIRYSEQYTKSPIINSIVTLTHWIQINPPPSVPLNIRIQIHHNNNYIYNIKQVHM